jgi:hypothetical protein
MFAINKVAIIKKEFSGLEQPVSLLFPTTAPYSDVDLSPVWDYNIEEAKALNCPVNSNSSSSSSLSGGAIAGIVIAVLFAVAILGYFMYRKGDQAGFSRYETLQKKKSQAVDMENHRITGN